MRPLVLCAIFTLPVAGLAERYSVPFYEQPTQSDQLFLKQIQVLTDENERIELMKKFRELFPKHEACAWITEQLQIAYLSRKQFDESMAEGERLLSLDGLDLDAIWRSVKAAETKGDEGALKKWREIQDRAAKGLLASPEPAEAAKKEQYRQMREMAEALFRNEEYAAYQRVSALSEHGERQAALAKFEETYPKSLYLRNLLLDNLRQARQTGDPRSMIESAEKLLSSDGDNPEALLLVAQLTLQSHQGADKPIRYANRVLAWVRSAKKPEGQSDGDWEREKGTYTTTAYTVLGSAYLSQQEWTKVDQALRQALPGIVSGGGQGLAAALFYLGWANYQLERYGEAGKFFTECAQYQSEFQTQAWQNVTTLKRERRIP